MLLCKIQLPRKVRLSRRTKEFQLISFFQHQLLYLRLRATQGAHNPSCYQTCVVRMQPALDGIYPLFQKRSLDQNYLLGKASLIAKVQIGKSVLFFIWS